MVGKEVVPGDKPSDYNTTHRLLKYNTCQGKGLRMLFSRLGLEACFRTEEADKRWLVYSRGHEESGPFSTCARLGL